MCMLLLDKNIEEDLSYVDDDEINEVNGNLKLG